MKLTLMSVNPDHATMVVHAMTLRTVSNASVLLVTMTLSVCPISTSVLAIHVSMEFARTVLTSKALNHYQFVL